MKILYVDDDDDDDDKIYIAENRLSRGGFTVVIATDAVQGSEQPDSPGTCVHQDKASVRGGWR